MTAAAEALLLPAPASEPTPRRHLDIAPTRAQKRARPRIYGAIVAIAGIGAILLGQLLMSIVLADGAYQISALQIEKRDLVREQHAATETLQQLSSTQSLMQNATSLGMTVSGTPLFLDIETGQALGQAGPAKGQIVGAGGNLIGNALIADGSTMLAPTPDATAASPSISTSPVAGVESANAPASGVAPGQTVSGTIPSPVTR